MPKMWMLIGVPASGKSTYRQTLPADATVLSTDDRIEVIATALGKTYSEVFRDHIGQAEKDMYQQAMQAFARGDDVIWDQTNLTKKTRAKKLIMVPDEYEKIGVYFSTPAHDEHKRRLDGRKGKVIPPNVMMGMVSQLQAPTKDEGFDRIISAV